MPINTGVYHFLIFVKLYFTRIQSVNYKAAVCSLTVPIYHLAAYDLYIMLYALVATIVVIYI